MSIPSSALRRTFVALSCIAPSFAPIALAQQGPADQPSLGGVTVTSTAIDANDGGTLESPKRTREVRDTPQTITVLTDQVIEQQNLLTLRDILSTVPGITFGAGEGGSGYGDSVNFRGYSANNDITIDGVRDSAQYTRSDPFDIQQIEVTNGANSVVNGVGSVGGNINIVSKLPQAQTSDAVSGSVGTDDYWRGTVDLNQRVSNLVGVRLNAMIHRNDVPGRDVENYKRWGVAPAVTIGMDGPTSLTLAYVHQQDHNIPQYGVPYYKTATNDGPLPGVDRSDYFGYRNLDTQRVNLDRMTAELKHEFSDKVSIRDLARWQDVRQYTVADPPQGTYCLAAGVTPTGAACAYPGYFAPTIAGPRGTVRDTRNQLLFDQVDVRAVVNTGPVEHTLDLGGAATWEKFFLAQGNTLRNANGTNAYVTNYPLILLSNPNTVVPGGNPAFLYGSNVYTGPVNVIPSARQTGEQTNVAAYLFDTMKLGKLELSAGGRIERNTGTYRADTISTATATLGAFTPGSQVGNADTLFSYRVGLTYKPVEAVSLYAAYGNSHTPSKAAVNGSCTIAGVNGATSSTCDVDPESAKNYEIGAKAQLGAGVLLSVAAFRNERDKYLVASNDPTVPDQQLDGHSRVDGIAIGANGKITKAWTITANYTYLKGRLLQSVSDFCLAHPGQLQPVNGVPTNVCLNSAANPDPGKGARLTNTPRHSGSVFTTYELPFGLTVGYGLTYQGSFVFNTPTLAAPLVLRSDDYLIHQAYLAYAITPHISAQVNVKNIGDKLYYTRIRNNGWATPGDARSAVFTLTATM